MALRPRLSDIPKIRGAVKWYRASAYVTGTLLLLLVLEMVLKYTPIQREIELGGTQGVLALVPDGTVRAVNLSTGILIAHGWLYVVYLFADFRLWSFMRWPFMRFIQIALGGVIPFLSFIVEHFITRRVHAELAELEHSVPASAAPSEVTNH
jgi:integral membrane protein